MAACWSAASLSWALLRVMRTFGNWQGRERKNSPVDGSVCIQLFHPMPARSCFSISYWSRYALSRLGLKDVALNAQIGAAAKQFSAQEMLGFDPVSEPPASDLSYQCDCGLKNERGRTFCKQCRRRLEIQSRYRVWMEALSSTYVSERCGILFGARYLDVLKWLPTMRPYPVDGHEDVEFLRDAIYAVTHIVYTLNDYSTYRLRPSWLPQEFAFLKANVASACERKDPEVLGELLDSLKAFGLRASHPLIMSRHQILAGGAKRGWELG